MRGWLRGLGVTIGCAAIAALGACSSRSSSADGAADVAVEHAAGDRPTGDGNEDVPPSPDLTPDGQRDGKEESPDGRDGAAEVRIDGATDPAVGTDQRGEAGFDGKDATPDGGTEAGADVRSDAGASDGSASDAVPIVCGDGIVQQGETCDFPNGIFCQNCHVTLCEGALAANGAVTPSTDTACPGLGADASAKCRKLLNCVADLLFECADNNSCVCSDATCANGSLNGSCAAQAEAVAGSTDPTEIARQMADPTSTLARVLDEGSASVAAAAPAGMYCASHPGI